MNPRLLRTAREHPAGPTFRENDWRTLRTEAPQVMCPRIVSMDVDGSYCKIHFLPQHMARRMPPHIRDPGGHHDAPHRWVSRHLRPCLPRGAACRRRPAGAAAVMLRGRRGAVYVLAAAWRCDLGVGGYSARRRVEIVALRGG
jgi:hypothetical protein